MSKSPDSIATAAFRCAASVTLVVLALAVALATLVLLPYGLDSTIPWSMLVPFARSFMELALETALLVGWPVGWAWAMKSTLVCPGNMHARETGSPPLWRRLWPQAVLLACTLSALSALLGSDASAPGRIVRTLLAEGRAACAESANLGHAETFAVPFVGATWLCPPHGLPLLVGKAPIGDFVFSAGDARISDDLRRIELDDAHVTILPRSAENFAVRLRVGVLNLRGLAPLTQPSSLPPALRAFIMGLSGLVAASASVFVLRRKSSLQLGSAGALAVGASGPLTALLILHVLERRIPEEPPLAWLLLFLIVPGTSLTLVFVVSKALDLLPGARRSATK